jgi:uncharacterized protein (DUF1499 family)
MMRRVATFLTILAAVLMVTSGPALRFGWTGIRNGLLMFAGSSVIALIAALLAAIAWLRHRPDRRAALVFAVAALLSLVPISQILPAMRKPPIHDVSTDPADPPMFAAVLPLRRNAPNPIIPFDEKRTSVQKNVYPDIVPLDLTLDQSAAFSRALDAARQSGWEIVSARPADGAIEATDTTAWFGFRDDVAIRIRPRGGSGSRVDVRSTSRVGGGDAGKNANRIRHYLAMLRAH